MSTAKQYWLKRRLFWRLLAVQSAVFALVVAILFASGKLVDFKSTDNTIEILSGTVSHQQSGDLHLTETRELRSLRKDEPDLWFVIRDMQGHSLAEGNIPGEYINIGNALDHVGQARLGWNIGDPDRPTARMRWVNTRSGRLQFTTGTSAPASARIIALGVLLLIRDLVAPIVAVMALGAFIATPLVLRKTLAGMDQAAKQADSIDIYQRGARLSMPDIPQEVVPLVRAMNQALDRLDEGYERQNRFLADAAHELRTPIAILNIRIESLPHSSAKVELLEDSTRLAVLTEQMLDLERLRQGKVDFSDIDLAALARKVILEIAPLAFASGYTVDFFLESSGVVQGDPLGLERALTNVMQNAIAHGGRAGAISVKVGSNWVEIGDEGPGIPAALRERIFEPFFKHNHNGRGAGLGLNLVRDILRMHGGDVTIVDRDKGAAFLLSLPSYSVDKS